MLAVFFICLVLGLLFLTLSADKFVDSASATAKHLGMSPLLIGMLIIGFGTSAPELVVSILSSVEGNSGIALGNAYGSNITNIALILGATALFKPIIVESQVIKRELPLLTFISILSVALIFDLHLSRVDAIIHLLIFSALMGWTCYENIKEKKDVLAEEVEQELKSIDTNTSMTKVYLTLIVSLIILIASSRLLVYGAVGIATYLGVSDLIIGLTIVALGTSLPEFASSIIAVRKGESDLALGNVIGSNFFNTLMVVGLSGVIHPLDVEKEFFYRDSLLMVGITVSLFILGFGFKKPGKITRFKGLLLTSTYVAYVGYLVYTSIKN